MTSKHNTERGAVRGVQAGDILSFSSGTISHSPHRYRVLDPHSLSATFKPIVEQLGLQSKVLPFVINANPSPLGMIDFGVSVDSYLNMSTIHRALRLCAMHNSVAIICCQPLFALHIIQTCRQHNIQLPLSICFVLGGYYCPASAERYLINAVRSCNTACTVLHAYGVSEVDFAILIGKRSDDGIITYRQASPACKLSIENGQLLIDTGDSRLVPGDKVQMVDSYWHIEQDQRTLAPAVYQELETWTQEQWERRTGYLQFRPKGTLYQLRKGYQPVLSMELDFFDFARRSEMSWLLKPDWSSL